MAAINKQAGAKKAAEPWLEWITSSVGVLVTVTLLILLGWGAWIQDDTPPALVIQTGTVAEHEGGYTLPFSVRNISGSTAARVGIEGVLTEGDRVVETAQARLDYVPGYSTRKGGLFFSNDPRGYRLQVRPLGYEEP